MSIEAGRDKHFWDKIADKYNRQKIANQEVYERKVQLTQAFLNTDMQVMEFGCGTGSTAILHAPFVNHYLATDISGNMIAHGRRKAIEAGVTNLTFEETSIEALANEGRTFDAVLGLNVIHLCRDPRAVIHKVRNLLQPGGVFIQSTACVKDFGPITGMFIPLMQMMGKAPYVNKFSSEELHEMMDETGFHIVEEFSPGGLSADFLVARRAAD